MVAETRTSGAAPDTVDGSLGGNSFLILVSGCLTGVANYGFSLALVWLLASRAFAVLAGVNSLLVVVGTAGAAALPWLVARQVALHPAGSPARRQAVSFALVAAVVLGLATAAVVVGIASTYAGTGVLVGLGVTTLALFVASPGLGYLQGAGRFRLLAGLALVEVGLKVGLGSGLAAAGLGPIGAVAGAAVGAVVLAGAGLAVVRGEIGIPQVRVEPEVWRSMAGIGGIQIAVSALSTLDVVVASVVDGSTPALGRYQAMLVLARIPLFVSTALSFVVYPRLVAADDDSRIRVVRETTTLYLALGVLVAATVASIPATLLTGVLPQGYGQAFPLLLPLALAGLATGTVNLVTTYLQADGAFRAALRILSVGLVVAVVVEGRQADPVRHLAWAAAGIDVAVAAAMVVVAARRYPAAQIGRRAAVAVVALAATCALFTAVRPVPVVWGVDVVGGALGLVAAYHVAGRQTGRTTGARTPAR